MVGGLRAKSRALPAGASANHAAPLPAIPRPTIRPKPNRFITSWKALFFRCTTTIVENFWKSCSTPSPSTDRSSTPSAWYSSTLRTRICTKRRGFYCPAVARFLSLQQAVLVQVHADGGIHADFFEVSDLAASPDTASGDDRM